MRRLGEILDLGASDAALADREITGLCADSRKAEPGEVFFALAGSAFFAVSVSGRFASPVTEMETT